MSQKSLTDISKIEWLKSVRVALTGFIGALFLMMLIKIWNGIDSPEYLNWFVPINMHFFDAVFLGIMNVCFIAVLAVWTPVEQGTRENEAKLFYLNWKVKVSNIEKFLLKEEGDLVLRQRLKEILEAQKDDNGGSENPAKVDSDITNVDANIGDITLTESDYINFDSDGNIASTHQIYR